MSDHEFEKKMQQKMDDLRLRPSEAVWGEVERNLRRDKRRRRIVLWLPLMGILLTAGGYFIFKTPGKPGNESLAKTAPAQKTITPDASATPSASTAAVPKPATETETETVSGHKSATQSKPESEASSPVLSSSKNTNTPSSQNSTPPDSKTTVKNKTVEAPPVTNKQAARIPKQKSFAEKTNRERKSKSPERNVTDNKPVEKNTKGKEDVPKTVVDSNAIVSNDNKIESKVDSSATAKTIATTTDSSANKKATPPAIVKTPAKKKQSAVSKWQWGVNANAGFASISEGSLLDVLKSVRVDDLTGAGAPSYNGIPPVPTPEASPISQGAAFTVGAFVQRNLSKRFGISAGLQYSYFSVRTEVGKRVDSALAVNYGTYYSQVASNYYRADQVKQDYTNRYHFIELPVTASYRIINSKKFPVLLDIGMSFSRLLSTTALHFDGIGRVYYENDDFFKKMQMSLNGGLSLGILQNSKHPLWVGPNLRYFTTGLIRKEVSASDGEQHIWSFGVNAKMLLKK